MSIRDTISSSDAFGEGVPPANGDTRWENEWEDITHFPCLRIGRIQSQDKMLEARRPISRLENAKKCDNILAGRISNHERAMVGGREYRRLYKFCHLNWRRDDETCIILEQITSDRSNAILLLCQVVQDVREICDILWGAGKMV
jgi:hypothetical protein